MAKAIHQEIKAALEKVQAELNAEIAALRLKGTPQEVREAIIAHMQAAYPNISFSLGAEQVIKILDFKL